MHNFLQAQLRKASLDRSHAGCFNPRALGISLSSQHYSPLFHNDTLEFPPLNSSVWLKALISVPCKFPQAESYFPVAEAILCTWIFKGVLWCPNGNQGIESNKHGPLTLQVMKLGSERERRSSGQSQSGVRTGELVLRPPYSLCQGCLLQEAFPCVHMSLHILPCLLYEYKAHV